MYASHPLTTGTSAVAAVTTPMMTRLRRLLLVAISSTGIATARPPRITRSTGREHLATGGSSA